MNPVGYIEEHYDIYINEAKGVVVTKIEPFDLVCLLEEEITHLERKMGYSVRLDGAAQEVMARVLGKQEIQLMAKAKCNYDEGEIWNEKCGVDLAVRRLTNQILKIEAEFWWQMSQKMADLMARTEKIYNGYVRRIEDNYESKRRLTHEMWGKED